MLHSDFWAGDILKEHVRDRILSQLHAAGLEPGQYSAYLVGDLAAHRSKLYSPFQVIVSIDNISAKDFNDQIGKYLQEINFPDLHRKCTFAFVNGLVNLNDYNAVYDIKSKVWFKGGSEDKRAGLKKRKALVGFVSLWLSPQGKMSNCSSHTKWAVINVLKNIPQGYKTLADAEQVIYDEMYKKGYLRLVQDRDELLIEGSVGRNPPTINRSQKEALEMYGIKHDVDVVTTNMKYIYRVPRREAQHFTGSKGQNIDFTGDPVTTQQYFEVALPTDVTFEQFKNTIKEWYPYGITIKQKDPATATVGVYPNRMKEFDDLLANFWDLLGKEQPPDPKREWGSNLDAVNVDVTLPKGITKEQMEGFLKAQDAPPFVMETFGPKHARIQCFGPDLPKIRELVNFFLKEDSSFPAEGSSPLNPETPPPPAPPQYTFTIDTSTVNPNKLRRYLSQFNKIVRLLKVDGDIATYETTDPTTLENLKKALVNNLHGIRVAQFSPSWESWWLDPNCQWIKVATDHMDVAAKTFGKNIPEVVRANWLCKEFGRVKVENSQANADKINQLDEELMSTLVAAEKRLFALHYLRVVVDQTAIRFQGAATGRQLKELKDTAIESALQLINNAGRRLADRSPSKICIMARLQDKDAKPILSLVDDIPEEDLYTEGDEYGKEEDTHVTVLYGLLPDKVDLADVKKIVSGYGPIELTLGKISKFKQDDYDVLKIDCQSTDLGALNEKLKELPYKNDYDKYLAHCTLAYVKPGKQAQLVDDDRFEGKKVTIDSVIFSPGDGGNKTTISLGTKKEAAFSYAEYWLSPAVQLIRATPNHLKWIVNNKIIPPGNYFGSDEEMYRAAYQKGWVRVVITKEPNSRIPGDNCVLWSGRATQKQLKELKDLAIEKGLELRRGGSRWSRYKQAVGKRFAQIIATDRYKALGIDYPNPKTMCDGQCEGIGFVPIKADEKDPKFKKLWDEAEKKEPTDDGWHFVKCPDCNGTGNRIALSNRSSQMWTSILVTSSGEILKGSDHLSIAKKLFPNDPVLQDGSPEVRSDFDSYLIRKGVGFAYIAGIDLIEMQATQRQKRALSDYALESGLNFKPASFGKTKYFALSNRTGQRLGIPNLPESARNPMLVVDPKNPDNVLIYHGTRNPKGIGTTGIRTSNPGVISKAGYNAVFASHDPSTAKWKTDYEEDLKRQRGWPTPKGDQFIAAASLPYKDIVVNPKNGDIQIHRDVTPEEVIGLWPSRKLRTEGPDRNTFNATPHYPNPNHQHLLLSHTKIDVPKPRTARLDPELVNQLKQYKLRYDGDQLFPDNIPGYESITDIDPQSPSYGATFDVPIGSTLEVILHRAEEKKQQFSRQGSNNKSLGLVQSK